MMIVTTRTAGVLHGLRCCYELYQIDLIALVVPIFWGLLASDYILLFVLSLKGCSGDAKGSCASTWGVQSYVRPFLSSFFDAATDC